MKKGGCWIFLSHSSQDIEKVRVIRNEFEKCGQNPLAFHLRCLTTDTKEGRDELDMLIKREIDAREWFIFCESPNAEASPYVKMEKSYILSSGKKKVWSISMNSTIEQIRARVEEICKEIKVFISYTRYSKDSADILANLLEERDYNVWSDDDIKTGTLWSEEITSAIKEVASSGFFVAFITEDYVNSNLCMDELEFAIESGAKIIALVFGDCKMPPALRKHHHYFIPHMPTREDMTLIVDLIEAELKRRIVGPISYQADAWNKLAEIQVKMNYDKRYHSMEAVCVHSMGASDDYCEIYEFPCCGRHVIVGDGPVSRFRSDGCCKDEK